jgi:hypothetical protein
MGSPGNVDHDLFQDGKPEQGGEPEADTCSAQRRFGDHRGSDRKAYSRKIPKKMAIVKSIMKDIGMLK